MGLQLLASISNGFNFGMGGGIVVPGDLITTLSDNFIVFNNDCAKRATLLLYRLAR
jgi:hypothetical protein